MGKTTSGRDGAAVGGHAVVLGASLAGLAAAGTLAARFDRVTVVDRDTMPTAARPRRGVPQGRHAHLLLPSGLTQLAELFPGLGDDLRRRGAHLIPANEFRFYAAGGRLRLDGSRLAISGATRPLIEGVVRERLCRLDNVRLLDGCEAGGPTATGDGRVTGVWIHAPHDVGTEQHLAADLVVDATGRGSRSPRWLTQLGYAAPEPERLHIGVHYSTRLFRRDPGELDGCRHVAVGVPTGERRGGLVLAVEDDRWLVTLVGILGERPPTDLDGFIGYAGSLCADELHELAANAEPASDAATGAFQDYVRHRYDRLREFPAGYVVVGDAVCSLNPLYGQGMSVAIGEAAVLGRVLDDHGLSRIGPRFFRRSRRLVDAAWSLATGSDLGHPDVVGERTTSWRMLNAYINRLLSAGQHDPIVAGAFLEVASLVASPPRLMRPRIVGRVLRNGTAMAASA